MTHAALSRLMEELGLVRRAVGQRLGLLCGESEVN